MKRAATIPLAIFAIALAAISIFATVRTVTTGAPQPQHAVCLQSHREVVLIPTICGKADVCQKPVVVDVCDRIQAPPPRPMCQGNSDDE